MLVRCSYIYCIEDSSTGTIFEPIRKAIQVPISSFHSSTSSPHSKTLYPNQKRREKKTLQDQLIQDGELGYYNTVTRTAGRACGMVAVLTISS